MIYLPCKHDIISVPSYATGIYHPLEADIISKIYHPFREERISCKKPPGKSLEAFYILHIRFSGVDRRNQYSSNSTAIV